MAEVHSSNQEGIKLFGKMIMLQSRKIKNEEEPLKSEDDIHNNPTDHDQMKRPEKIIPCPRCKSMETKFCYFNNYNVNQPRHFCKGCQRYWTAGGALRNVPIGAGRRRIKPPNCCSPGVDDLPEDYQLYDASRIIHQLELDGVVGAGWHVMLPQDDLRLRQAFPNLKRQKISLSQHAAGRMS